MTSAYRLFELQQFDTEIQNLQQSVNEINRRLSVNEPLTTAQRELENSQQQLVVLSKQQKELDQDVAAKAENVKKLKSKLYGGTVKNPKELVDLDLDVKNIQANLSEKEEALFTLMMETESLTRIAGDQKQHVASLESSWEKEKVVLSREKADLESRLSDMMSKRQELAGEIDEQSLSLYNAMRTKRGTAVSRVEMGRCQGCRVNLSVTELKQSRIAIIQCSSCGRILYNG